MLKQIIEKVTQWESDIFASKKDANIDRYMQFVDGINVCEISESGLRSDIVEWCTTNSATQNRL